MPPQQYEVTVDKVLDAADNVKLIWFKLPAGQYLDFQPGQFMTVLLPREGTIVRKQYSISSPPFIKDSFEMCVNRIPNGFASNFLCDLQPGTKLSVIGPYGVFTLKEPLQHDPIFIATGTGIGPLKSMLDVIWEKKLDNGGDVWLFFGVRTEKGIIYDQDFKKMEKEHPNFHYIQTLSRPESDWQGHKGYVQEQVKKYIQSPDGKEAYICGVIPMVSDVRKTLAELGFPKEKVYFENYV